jgi:CRISPR/Cas system-associated exonuclease Cas4 (RecB family)
LLTLEQARAEAATKAWSAGLRGVALADTCTPQRTEAEWFDPTLRMHGFCDELWNDGRAARPVELKTSPPSPKHRAANRYQVAAYAFLARQVEGLRVDQCEVEYLRDGARDRFAFGTSWERKIRDGVERVSDVSRSPAPPAGFPSEDTCGWCPFQHTCPESLAPSLDDAFANLRVFDEVGERGNGDNH